MPDSVLTSEQVRAIVLLKSLISFVTFNYVCVSMYMCKICVQVSEALYTLELEWVVSS